MSTNEYLDQFLMFYSQSDTGNGQTRGLETDLLRRTYVETKLDRHLAPAILDGKYKLVILTGNAGDGKTAFVQQVEGRAERDRGAKIERIGSSGSNFTVERRTYRTVYDGSVDADGRPNAEVLAEVFKPFEGDSAPTGNACVIVAMNEGKLRDFLGASKRHGWLSTAILGHLNNDHPLPDSVALVNLNLRSVVDAAEESLDSIFDRILDRFVANEFWEGCDACPAKHRCPVKFNVDTFRVFPTGAKGDQSATEARNNQARLARARLKAVFQILHFRKRIHVTVRDLRSVLAFMLFGKRTCAEIEAAIASGGADFTDSYYYNAIFNSVEKDRLLALLVEFDVGRSSSPHVDAELNFTAPKSREFRQMFTDLTNPSAPALGRTPSDEDDLEQLYASRPQGPDQRSPEALSASRRYVLSLRRKLFFEGRRRGDETSPVLRDDLVPYDNLLEFMGFVRSQFDQSDRLKSKLVLGISRSEGIADARRGYESICIRTRQDQETTVKSFFVYPGSEFELTLPKVGTQERYVEYLPANLVMRYLTRFVTLDISLDLYEMLMRIRDGYVPTAGEMRTYFLNLLMFKKQLMSAPSDELLLTENDYQLYRLRRTPSNGVEMAAV